MTFRLYEIMLLDKYIDAIEKLNLTEESKIIQKFTTMEENTINRIKKIDATQKNLKKEKFILQKKLKQLDTDFTNALTKELFKRENNEK